MKSKIIGFDNFYYLLVIIYFIFLPFNYALTYHIGFPLKISEVVLFGIFLVEVRREVKQGFSWRHFIANKTLLLFLVVAFISLLLNYFWQYPYKLDLSLARINPVLDSGFKFIYYGVVVYAFTVVAKLLPQPNKYLVFLFIGGCVAGAYTWYLFITSILDKETFLLPGMDVWPQHGLYSFGHFIRSGTFKEGNYTGHFLFTTAVLAWHQRKYIIATFLFLSILPTVSSMAICCSILFISVSWLFYFIRKKYYVLIGLGLLLAVFTGYKLSQNEDVRSLIIVKLSAKRPPENVRSAGWSGDDRKNLTLVSLGIIKNNFWWGVGPANFYLHFNHYNTNPAYRTVDLKRIPGNVYLEVFTELGILGLLLFLYFLFQLYQKLDWRKNFHLKLGFILSCVYLLAFPTFSILFLWTFYGYIYSID